MTGVDPTCLTSRPKGLSTHHLSPQDLAFDTKLAFCRCSSATGVQQLWASLVEKAYAKAHGSYQSISGGWVAEALLDLTG